ncbi:chemotaxis protein [Acidovorax sp. SUPP1855]|uniref:hypothetical protein n=1 Tax=Acidovorax sp. SUPP1855 TaxID=431774 RepID=UPI0023DE2066|nr:hypothetical protein [Acidovorax sp. SUPP1855]GKS83208.1 chemotaxis protein [Acidovorax sp. SUPP1855]
MEPPDLNSVPGGPFAALSAAAAAIAGGAVVFRQWLSRGAADRADDAGRVSAINVYKELLEAERLARAEADKRADGFAKERNDAVTALGELRGQLAAMSRQLEDQNAELGALREQVRALKEQIDAKP